MRMMDDYMPPEEYPDWDGDESIMYQIDNYNEEDEEVICEVCGNVVCIGDVGSFTCPECGTQQNI